MGKFERWYVQDNRGFDDWYEGANEEQRGNDAMFKMSMVMVIAAVVIFFAK